MNPFKRIFENARAAAGKAAAAVKNLFRRKPETAPQEPPKSPQQIRQEKRINAETEAQRRALWAIQNAINKPDDRTAQNARRQAIEYLSRAEHLKGKGTLQDWNRQKIAERFIESDYSTATGQEEIKRKKLETFNQNFGFDLTRGEAKKVSEIMETSSYKKLLEKNKEMYDVIIQGIGDAIDNRVDPLRIEGFLSILEKVDMVLQFDDFSKVLQLSDNEYKRFNKEATKIANRKVLFDQDYQQRENDFNDLILKALKGELAEDETIQGN